MIYLSQLLCLFTGVSAVANPYLLYPYTPQKIHLGVINPNINMYGSQYCNYCYKGATEAECNHPMGCSLTDGLPQMCFMEKFVEKSGQEFYHGGCASVFTCQQMGYPGLPEIGDATRVCAQCCKGNLCNRNLCAQSAGHGGITHRPVITTTTPYPYAKCFSCDGVQHVEQCSETKSCALGESCYLEAYEADSMILYYGGCAPQKNCSSTSLPDQQGTRVCTACCAGDYCNYDVCDSKIAEYHASAVPKTQCYQCYDLQAQEVDECFSKVECSSSSSKCSQVVRNENGIETIDLDCEENLPCGQPRGTEGVVCSACCNSTLCNKDIDCGAPPSMTIVGSSITTTTAPAAHENPLQCYQCSDLRVDARGYPEPCYQTVTCSTYTSRCSTVFRDENGFTTVDMGCDDDLGCESGTTGRQLCGSCCDTDQCNLYEDCRNGMMKITPTVPSKNDKHKNQNSSMTL